MSTSTTPQAPLYRGRFAPSPTGPLHFGSLVAAVASYLQARVNQGEWLVRIEDIDPPREVPGATDAILDALYRHGFEFPPPLRQSSQLAIYDGVIDSLLEQQLAYRCSCSRKTLHASCNTGRAGIIYPGTCRQRAAEKGPPATSVRIRCNNDTLNFTDTLQGKQSCQLEAEIGDFLIRRGDGRVAYQLAVVVDDDRQGITEVVRGTDLLDSSFMQIWLQRQLGMLQPGYMHIPVAIGADGRKLSKQAGAAEIDSSNYISNLFQSFVFLGLKPDAALQRGATLNDLWAWGERHWHPDLLAKQLTRPTEGLIGV
jgi:glutamyl-Q tRNA(Asp) synthetase